MTTPADESFCDTEGARSPARRVGIARRADATVQPMRFSSFELSPSAVLRSIWQRRTPRIVMQVFLRSSWKTAAGVTCLTWAMLASASAQAQDDPRLHVYLPLGFGGEVDFGAAPGDPELDTTVGFGVRYEAPLHRYVSVGGHLETTFWRTELMDAANLDRNVHLDLDGFVMGRYPIRLRKFDLVPYLLLPIGLTISFPSFNDLDNGPGWNIGLLAGTQFIFSEHFGVMTELGFMRHDTRNDVNGGPSVDIEIMQFRLHLGAVVIF